jgi:hypothetical protein
MNTNRRIVIARVLCVALALVFCLNSVRSQQAPAAHSPVSHALDMTVVKPESVGFY